MSIPVQMVLLSQTIHSLKNQSVYIIFMICTILMFQFISVRRNQIRVNQMVKVKGFSPLSLEHYGAINTKPKPSLSTTAQTCPSPWILFL